MNNKYRVRAVGLVTCTLMFIGTLSADQARGADRLEPRISEVSQVQLKTSGAAREYLGVFGEVLARKGGTAIIRGHDHPEISIRVDTWRLPSADRRRFHDQCAMTPCFEVVTGRIVRGRLEATGSFHFERTG